MDEKPCEFVENDDVELIADVLYQRSKRCVVAKKNIVLFY